MDIFTTVLTRVVQTPIKPDRVRVKALSKEPSLNELTDDLDHLENHEQYVDLSKDHSEKKQHQQHDKENDECNEIVADVLVNKFTDNFDDDMAAVIIQKEELIHPKKRHDEPDEDIHHLDLFV
ncbi:MAG: hypothetical protein HRT54_00225 [Colwellia sp.]|nr:hypothetical protein [Colwellia sp.]